jgi:hypothetical protein
MQPATVAAVLDAIARHWSVATDVEVTLEANPTSVEAERFRGYRSAGVNRVRASLATLAVRPTVPRAIGHLRGWSGTGVDSGFAPPCGFVTGSVHLAMMAAAQRNDAFVADLAPERTMLRKCTSASWRPQKPKSLTLHHRWEPTKWPGLILRHLLEDICGP